MWKWLSAKNTFVLSARNIQRSVCLGLAKPTILVGIALQLATTRVFLEGRLEASQTLYHTMLVYIYSAGTTVLSAKCFSNLHFSGGAFQSCREQNDRSRPPPHPLLHTARWHLHWFRCRDKTRNRMSTATIPGVAGSARTSSPSSCGPPSRETSPR